MQKISSSLSVDVAADADELLARRSPIALLISGGAPHEVETVARRVHSAQLGHLAPFVEVKAAAFPGHAGRLQRFLAAPIDAATDGSLFISDVEQMPIRAQDAILNVLSEELVGHHSTARLISGTTVSLFHLIAAGQFSADLFYRLNAIHLVLASRRASPLHRPAPLRPGRTLRA
jgi:DNA-binding NtrC family response regulator